jgi:hypothetical protein
LFFWQSQTSLPFESPVKSIFDVNIIEHWFSSGRYITAFKYTKEMTVMLFCE